MNGEHSNAPSHPTTDERVNTRVKLDFEQRARACKLEDDVAADEYATAAEIIFLRDRNAQLERLLVLATELCVAVDRESEDIGGSRKSLDILQDIGPLTSQLGA